MLKKTEKICEIEKKYRICRRVYLSLYVDIADTFIQYIYLLEPDEIQYFNVTENGWGIESIADIKNSVELLQCFEFLLI